MDLQTLQTRQSKIVHDAEALLALADRETRGLTPDEEKQHDGFLKSLEDLGKQIAKTKGDDSMMTQLGDITGDPSFTENHLVVGRVRREKSLGQQVIESAVGEYLRKTKGGRSSGGWRSGDPVELKAVLLEDSLPPPDVLPGIVPSPQRPIVMSELFPTGPTNSNTILYMEETLFTNAAAPVAEGGLKPESTLTFANKTARVEKIAHWLPVSDEFLDDEPALRSYIDRRLRLGVLLELDDQLLNGTGVSPELHGLLVRTDLSPAMTVGTQTGPDAIAAQIAAVEQASQLPVDGIVMNGADWLKFGLLKATDGTYLGANPFDAPQAPTLWGRPVAITPGMPAGVALVGAFRSGGGQLFQRGGLRVDASNSHADYFIRNLTAIRAETRIALVLVRPVAFGKVTGLNPPA